MTTKIHMATDALGRPLRILLTPGQRGDVTQAEALLSGMKAMWILVVNPPLERPKAGVWEKVFVHLIDAPDNDYVMLDSTLVRAHQQAATGKGGTKIRLWGAPEED